MEKIKVLRTGYADISDLKPWGDNPRVVFDTDVEKLVRKIRKYGAYKPLVIDEDGLVLGGHARLKALNAIGEKTAWVSVVDAKTHAQRLFVAISDNDAIGATDPEKLMKLIGDMAPADLDDMTVDFGAHKSVEDILDEAGIGNEAPSDMADVPTIGKMILPFGNADYEKVLAVLEDVRNKEGKADHTEAVIWLLEQYAD